MLSSYCNLAQSNRYDITRPKFSRMIKIPQQTYLHNSQSCFSAPQRPCRQWRVRWAQRRVAAMCPSPCTCLAILEGSALADSQPAHQLQNQGNKGMKRILGDDSPSGKILQAFTRPYHKILQRCNCYMDGARVFKINSLAPGGFDYSLKLVNFKLMSTINILSVFCEIATTSHWSLINTGSGNGLVPSGNKPLPEPMLT